MWIKHLTLVLHDTTFRINLVPCTPSTEKENSEVCSCKSIRSFLPRLNTSGWVTSYLPKAEVKGCRRAGKDTVPWRFSQLSLVGSSDLYPDVLSNLAVTLAPAATWQAYAVGEVVWPNWAPFLSIAQVVQDKTLKGRCYNFNDCSSFSYAFWFCKWLELPLFLS